jgi:methylphosphotriester-DNA--protein-cysteine methyltransferase
MINHQDLHIKGFTGSRQLARLIREQAILFAGNRKLKIYGRLSCTSGKRMKTANRVFFANEQEAIDKGYRPCGHCLRDKYLLWLENK